MCVKFQNRQRKPQVIGQDSGDSCRGDGGSDWEGGTVGGSWGVYSDDRGAHSVEVKRATSFFGRFFPVRIFCCNEKLTEAHTCVHGCRCTWVGTHKPLRCSLAPSSPPAFCWPHLLSLLCRKPGGAFYNLDQIVFFLCSDPPWPPSHTGRRSPSSWPTGPRRIWAVWPL